MRGRIYSFSVSFYFYECGISGKVFQIYYSRRIQRIGKQISVLGIVGAAEPLRSNEAEAEPRKARPERSVGNTQKKKNDSDCCFRKSANFLSAHRLPLVTPRFFQMQLFCFS